MPDASKPVSTTDYSASQAPETQDSAHGERERDMRMIPGGGHDPATLMVGMESFDEAAWPRPEQDGIHSGDAEAHRHPHGRR